MPGVTLGQWGPAAWNTLHVIAHTSPHQMTEQQAASYGVFLRAFGALLPCPKCRDHFLRFLDERMTPRSLGSRAALVQLLHDAHNDVNRRTGKRILSLSEHYALYALPPPRQRLRWNAVVAASAIAFAAGAAAVARRRGGKRGGDDAPPKNF